MNRAKGLTLNDIFENQQRTFSTLDTFDNLLILFVGAKAHLRYIVHRDIQTRKCIDGRKLSFQDDSN